MLRRYPAVIVLFVLLAIFVLFKCIDTEDGERRAMSTLNTVPTTQATTTTVIPTTTTTTTIVPGSVSDPYGPILCPNVGHPAHHKPCAQKVARSSTGKAAPRASRTPVAPSGDLLGCLRHYESTNGAGSSNLYQFEPRTWESAGKAAGSTYKGSAASAPKEEQDKRAAAIIKRDGVQGHWRAQKGRCF